MPKAIEVAKRWLWRISKIAIVAAIIGAVIYQVRFSPVSVVAHTIERGPIIAEVMGTGTLEARVATTISPKIAGRIEKVVVDQGDRVSVGDTLVRLDDEELKQQVAIAQANVDAAEAAIARLMTDKSRATAVFEQAKKSYDRTQALIKSRAVSRDDTDKATEALAVATAGVSRAEAAITEGQQELVAAEKTLEYHRARLQDTEILAPFDGLIVNRQREPGDVVVPGSSILTLVSTDEMWISAWVDETEMAHLKPDQPARVVFRSESDCSRLGRVARLGREADRETREFVVDVRVLELPTNWAVGQRAEVFIEVAKKDDVITVPAQLIEKREGQSGVFVNVDNKANWQPIQQGLHSRLDVEVLEGIDAGDIVISPADPRTTLTRGRKVVMP
ncbi:MAG: efflux RND transporter periplasmic adaptor subunit [Planctomycetales bacterium]|nr:efflux RND transporter periplasmic adaptor subunit [Planctomycetales bacterium]